MELINRVALDIHGLRNSEEAHVRRVAQHILHLLDAHLRAKDFEANPSRVNHANGLHQALLERATNSHNFTDTLHGGTDMTVDLAGELGQIPLRDLGDYIIKRGLEAGGGGLGYGIRKFREGVSESDLSSSVRKRVTSSFRSERTVKRIESTSQLSALT